MPRSIVCYVDFISPYAYIATARLPAICARAGCELRYVPVLFAAFLEAHGTIGPAEVPVKRRYLMRDLVRKARRAGIPIDAPFAHPFNPLLALRIASLPMPEAERLRVVEALARATWVERRDVTDPAVVAEVLARAGLDPALAARAAEAKDALRAQTDAALARGVFGVPSMLVDDELFWGTDTLDDLERYLAGDDELPSDVLARWDSLPAAAQRPRRPAQ